MRYNNGFEGGKVADIQELLHKFNTDPKIAASRNFASRVYQDEPIVFTAPQMQAFTPPRIREMRRVGGGSLYEAKVFYEQAKFMESFEDDFDYRGEFSHYFPTYQHMTDAQVRGYFSWRTKVKKGRVEKTSLSFAFVYIYELLNRIGVDTAEDGFHTLKRFWNAYREFEPRLDSYLALWLKDYVVYNDLDRSLLEDLPDVAFEQAVTVLLDYKARGPVEIFTALNALASYDLADSRFFAQYPDDVTNVVHRVFCVISDYYNKNPKHSAQEKLFGKVCVSSYNMFKSAVFYPQRQRENRVYDVGSRHRYICSLGEWSCERFVWYGSNNKRLGAILKTIDYLMRREFGFKSSLQPGKTNKILTGKIEKEITRYLDDKRKNAPPKIDIDISKLHRIRTAALATRDKLLVEEEDFEPPPAVAAQEPPPADAPALDETERTFLRCLLYGDRYDDILRAKGVMASVVMDAVNEKLFDLFNDTVLVEGPGGPEPLDDYREELKGMFPE